MPGELTIATVITGLVSGYLGSVLTQNRVRWLEKRSLANAFCSEVIIIMSKMKVIESDLTEVIKMTKFVSLEEFHEQHKDKKISPLQKLIVIDKDDISIYNSNTSKIGVFSIEEVSDIINYYNKVRVSIKHCDEFNNYIGEELKVEDINEENNKKIRMKCINVLFSCEEAYKVGSELTERLLVYHDNWFFYFMKRNFPDVKFVRIIYDKLYN